MRKDSSTSILAGLVGIGAALALACGAAERAPAPPPATNLLWVSLDTLRADRLGCYGYERATTPTLDALAARGVRFEDACATSPWTMPSHASMFTGRYPSRAGIVSFTTKLRTDVPHVAELLRDQGFQTTAVVSNHAVTLHGLERGFDVFTYVERDPSPAPSDVTPTAIRQLEALDPDRPFFALVHYNAVHARYRARKKYVREFVEDYEGSITGRNAQFLAHVTGERPFTAADVAHLSNLYDAALRQLDDQLKELFAYLDGRALLEETLVVITSDHGEEFFDHDGVSHGMTQHQELVRVPMILLGAGVPAGRVVQEPVSLIDLLPTSLERLGLPVPEGMDGLSLVETWRDEDALPERLLYFEANCEPPAGPVAILDPGTTRAIRDERYKLLYDLEHGPLALYDLESDPNEETDVSAAHSERAAGLEAALKHFLDSAPNAATSVELSEEDLAELGALGYGQGHQ